MKTKVLISFTVSAKLICGFVFANARCWFSQDAAHLQNLNTHEIKPLRKLAHAMNRYFLALKIENYQLKIFYNFLIFALKHKLWVHVRCQDGSNAYPQSTFLS